MPLREELAVTGTFLFRWRSYLPLAILPLVFAQIRDPVLANDSNAHAFSWKALCLGTALFGMSLRAFVAGYVPRGTSGRNTRSQQCEELNSTGAYSVVRHPLYLGNFFIWVGVSLFPGAWWLAAVIVLVFWLYYERIMYAEEEFLRAKFGQRYLRWAAKTPAFLPDVRLFKKPFLPFSIRTVLRREYSGFFGVIAAFTLLELAQGWILEESLLQDPLRMAFLATGALAYLVLLYIKRHTRWLDAEGR